MLHPKVDLEITPPGFFMRLRRHLKNMEPLFRGPIDASVVQFFTRQFNSEGKVGGEPWAPLRPATLKIKRRSGRENMGILRNENRLWASLTKRAGPDTVLRTTPERYERGTSDPKAVWHQKGWTQNTIFGRQRRHPRKIKPRKMVPDKIPSMLVKAWERLMARYILGEVRL